MSIVVFQVGIRMNLPTQVRGVCLYRFWWIFTLCDSECLEQEKERLTILSSKLKLFVFSGFSFGCQFQISLFIALKKTNEIFGRLWNEIDRSKELNVRKPIYVYINISFNLSWLNVHALNYPKLGQFIKFHRSIDNGLSMKMTK